MKASSSNFGKRLSNLRKSARLTRYQLARKAGLEATELSRLEQGQHTPTGKTLKALATALNVPADELRARE